MGTIPQFDILCLQKEPEHNILCSGSFLCFLSQNKCSLSGGKNRKRREKVTESGRIVEKKFLAIEEQMVYTQCMSGEMWG